MPTLKIKCLSSEEQFRLLENIRFGQAPSCPYCSSSPITGRFPKDYHCNTCNRNFTLFTNTILHHSKLSPVDLLKMVKYYADSSSGISVRELSRMLEINKVTTNRFMELIRRNLPEDTTPFCGIVQADEAYIGGKNSNRHANKKKIKSKGRSTEGQQLILALYHNDTKQVKACLRENANMKQINSFVSANVTPSSTIYTDEWAGYKGLEGIGYKHTSVSHKDRKFVEDGVTTNGVENFWSFLKRAYKGAYISISKKRLELFLKEIIFRYNVPNHQKRSKIILTILLSPQKMPENKNKSA